MKLSIPGIAMYFSLALLLAGCDQAGRESSEPQASTEAGATAPSADAPRADIRGEEVSYTVGNQTFNGFLAYDAATGEARPGVIIVHEWWGHTDYVRNRARMLAELGYTALALDMYGDGKTADHPQDATQFMNELMGDTEAMQQRFNAALELLRQHPSTDATRVAAIGYCMGGAVVLNMARAGADLDGVASFHGSLGTSMPAQPNSVTAKVLVLHGADDPFVPAEQVDAFKQEMEQANVDYEFIAYPGAVHAYTNPDATELGEQFGLPLAYNEAADSQSWEKLQEFFDEIFAE